MLNKVAPLATHRLADLDLASCAQRQGFGEQPATCDVVRQEHELWRRLIIVELGHERLEHLLNRKTLVGAREVGAIAPVIAGAEDEHLDAGLPRLLVRGEDIRLFDAVRVDALARLDVRERGQAIAKARSSLIVLLQARLVHQAMQPALHLVAFAGEESERLVDQLAVVLGGDLAGARRRAALDLIEKARPQAALEISVGARSQQEGALQRVDRAADRAGRGKRPEIIAFAAARAAMLEDLRHRMVAGDENEREGLVVPQHHIEAWLQALDKV